jgi:hypothetical protein
MRIESCPPSPFDDSPGPIDRMLDRLFDWLGDRFDRPLGRDRAAGDGAPPGRATPLAIVRHEFVDALDDIPTSTADQLDVRIRAARSLRELWHLRADVFNAVSCYSSQSEARNRLSRLNRHFPVRTPKSGFGGFDVIPQGEAKS